MMKSARAILCFTWLAALAGPYCQPARGEVMLQWFETDWDEMYRRMPQVAEIGYDYLWIPPPTKAPTGLGTKWGNVGYNLYDRFDIGDTPQRGSYATRYGSRGSLRNMVDAAHRCDVKIIPDIIMNHNGNGPDFRDYPGMATEDFHVQFQSGYYNTLNYKRAPRMTDWNVGGGYGGTMWQDLASLIDIRTEDNPQSGDPNRFTGGANTPGWNFVAGTSFRRHVGQYDKYPYYNIDTNTYKNEEASEMLNRWITWLGNAMDYDGLRLDAGKHTPYEFFGTRGAGFLHEAQYNYNQRRGLSDSDANEADSLFRNYTRRDDALIFAEILSPWSEISYWYSSSANNANNNNNNDRNPMRYLDYAIKKTADSAFNGNLGVLNNFGISFDPTNGIYYVWGHDEGGPGKINLAYAYTLTHIGFPMVYFTGNNISWDDSGRTPDKKTWMIPGYDSQAMGDQYNDIPNLVYIHQQFARGREWNRWNENNDYFAYERYDDINGNATPDTNEGLLLVGLNDSGGNKTLTGVTVSFPVGTVLHDYTGHSGDETVYNSGGPKVNITIPGNSGQGWVCYAPRNADGNGNNSVMVKDNGSSAGSIPWVTPGGVYGFAKTQQITRVTTTNLTIDVFFKPNGTSTVDAAFLKVDRGTARFTATNYMDSGSNTLTGGFEKMNVVNATNWTMNLLVNATNLTEGLHAVRGRVFNQRDPSLPALFNTFTKSIYVDTKGPELNIAYPASNQTIVGEGVMVITNADFTAYGMTVAIDGAPATTAHEIFKGLWKFNLAGLSAGTHTATVTATEADWAASRNVINTSIYTRVFNIAANANSIALNHAEDSTLQLPFFKTAVAAPGSPSSVHLYWNGYELPFQTSYTNTFNGLVVFRDNLGNVVTDRLWGAFVNGPNFFEAERVDAGVTSRVSRHVTLNLYGINAIDSDGDSIPDNVEMPFIDSNGAPGADQPWPGDSNQNFIPDNGESWSKLNPYNHSTFYSGQWDDQNDFDGDGFNNGAELMAGYQIANIYAYNIYNGASKPPTGTPTIASSATWSPALAVRGQNLQITYSPNEGPLEGISPIQCHIGHSEKTMGSWQQVIDTNMTVSGTNWVLNYLVPTNATSVDFVFRNVAGTTWDNNNTLDWQAQVQGTTTTLFNINGTWDSTNFTVFSAPGNMTLLAAVRGTHLYVATYGVAGSPGFNDHFIYVTDELGDAAGIAPNWSKIGAIFMDTGAKPYISAEGDNRFVAWNHASGSVTSSPNAVEGELDLVGTFGYVPDAIYLAAVAFSTTNGSSLNEQGPFSWNGNDSNVDLMELLRVPVASIRDDNLDGFFDAGRPQMWTIVNSSTNDANYGLRRFFVNETAGDTRSITVTLRPNVGTNALSNVELFSNLNRRDFAVLPGDEDPNTVTVNSQSTYYRAYAMTNAGGGLYSYTLPINKCGAYRINARYKVNGGAYVYYTDEGLRRDCAVVVSPTKSFDLTMYELNPMNAEATADNFAGRSTFRDMYLVNTNKPDVINSNYFGQLGMNMVWLQPVHPIGSEGRKTDPSTSQPYDPGSPYAVRNYWKVNPVLGDPSADDQAMNEFTNFVGELDKQRVGVMLDGTFNHSAWDCQIGDIGAQMFPAWATNAEDLIRIVRPQWYSQRLDYGEHATYYASQQNTDIAVAPDRIDFGKWEDAFDFNFGVYDALVQRPPSDTNNAWSSQWYSRYLLEEDRLEPLDVYQREIWQYFSYYPIYWLEKTGHPTGTPKSDSYKGIDGLRCDFAQGLPSRFWEYTINKTRSVKWDFIFMAESLDGYRTVNGSNRHGVGYRSARHFDVLNENMVFYWRDNFFSYFSWNGSQFTGANPTTAPTKQALDNRKDAFDHSPLLLDLTCHDEILPHDEQWRILYAYATVAAVDGAPMLFNGQEAGSQNDAAVYTGRPAIDAGNNFKRYEINFGKSIPHFQRYNHMTNVWNNLGSWAVDLNAAYQRIGRARLASPALRSQNEYFLSGTNGYNPNIFGLAKFEAPGVSASSQEVVFAFVNNNYQESTNRFDTYSVNAVYNGGPNWFGIEAGKTYNIVDLASTTPTNYIWSPSKLGSELLANGITVILNGPFTQGKQAQYLRLVDVAATYPDTDADGVKNYTDIDDDNDGLPDWWEALYGLDPLDATGDNGANGDPDGDGMTNYEEFIAGTNPNDPDDALEINHMAIGGSGVDVTWDAVKERNYRVEKSGAVDTAPWQSVVPLRTALSTNETATSVGMDTNAFFRVIVQP